MWIFLSRDWNTNPVLNYTQTCLVAGGFVIYAILVIAISVILKIASLELINSALPMALIMMVILLSSSWPLWLRAIVIVLLILSTFFVNSFTQWLKTKLMQKKIK